MATLRRAILHACPAGFRLSFVISLTSIILALCAFSLAQMLTVLHVFNGGRGDGYNPSAPPVVDPNGVVYGTTYLGGNLNCPGGVAGLGCGEVFEVVPPAEPGGSWTYSAIYEFTGLNDGCCVTSALTLDSKGRLYGVNNSLFRLTRPAKQGAFWNYRDLYDFTNGLYPGTPLLIDNAGALYGVSAFGGVPGCGGNGCGAVLQFVPAKHGQWTENILYQFTGGADGAFPVSIVMESASGTLYGIADGGGIMAPNCTYGCGAVFELAPAQGGTWTYSVLYSFSGVHDDIPYASVVRDSNGHLYGLANRGQYSAEVFRVTPHKRGVASERLLHRFSPQNIPADYCGYPPTYLTGEPDGALYGAIFGDIDLYFGALFQLTPPVGQGPWIYTTLWDFNESGPDLNPNGVVLGPDGALYGTLNGGDSDGGSVFQLQLPSQAPWPPSDFCY